jgi:hypothetical protein
VIEVFWIDEVVWLGWLGSLRWFRWFGWWGVVRRFGKDGHLQSFRMGKKTDNNFSFLKEIPRSSLVPRSFLARSNQNIKVKQLIVDFFSPQDFKAQWEKASESRDLYTFMIKMPCMFYALSKLLHKNQ